MNEAGSEVVVQTIGKAAAKTFLQAFLGSLVVTLLPVLSTLQADLTDGDGLQVEDLNVVGLLVFAAIIAGIAALISFAWNYFRAPTLPGVTEVRAEVKQ